MPSEIEVKTILNRRKLRDPWFLDDYTLNLYSSCSFNCLYCYIRGSRYGTNLEKSLSVKINAIELLEKQLKLRASKSQHGIIVVSSATDPYLQIEKKYELTRRALELILKYRFAVHIITKSALVERDFDVLHEIDKNAIVPSDLPTLKRGVFVTFSFSTVSDKTGGIFEPGAPLPSVRLQTLKKTVDEGFLTGVSLMPLLPFISDTTAHLTEMFEAFKEAGVQYIMPSTLTLFGSGKADSKTLVMNAVRKYYPELEKRYEGYFSYSNEMPEFYQRAFAEKMQQMIHEYGFRNYIHKEE